MTHVLRVEPIFLIVAAAGAFYTLWAFIDIVKDWQAVPAPLESDEHLPSLRLLAIKARRVAAGTNLFSEGLRVTKHVAFLVGAVMLMMNPDARILRYICIIVSILMMVTTRVHLRGRRAIRELYREAEATSATNDEAV